MRLVLSAALVGILVTSITRGPVFAQETSEEFRIKEEYYRQKVEDFYTRLVLEEREEAERREAAEAKRKERVAEAAEHEKARRDFVAEQKQKPKPDPSLWEKENQERRLAHERSRKEYIKERDEFRNFQKRLPQIPPEEEFGFDIRDTLESE